MHRALVALLIFAAAPITAALACVDPGSVFFEDVPPGVDASAIVQVTIVEVSNTHPSRYFAGIGKVEKVIRGDIDRDTVTVLTALGDCLRRFPVGSHGIVIGDLQRGANGDIEILAIAETFRTRQMRGSGKN
jgi:hypothetical protein